MYFGREDPEDPLFAKVPVLGVLVLANNQLGSSLKKVPFVLGLKTVSFCGTVNHPDEV